MQKRSRASDREVLGNNWIFDTDRLIRERVIEAQKSVENAARVKREAEAKKASTRKARASLLFTLADVLLNIY